MSDERRAGLQLVLIVVLCSVVGLLASLVLVTAAEAAPGETPFGVEVVAPDPVARMFGDGWRIFVTGPLPADAAARVAQACDAAGLEDGPVYLVLDSRGGDPGGGMDLGRLARERGWRSEVGRRADVSYLPHPGTCKGAAFLAYLGGRFRFLDDDSVLAVAPALLTPATGRYLADLGFDDRLARRAASVPGDAVLQLTREGWTAVGVVDNGRHPVVWRLSHHEGITALVGEQDSWRGLGRVVITCYEDKVLLKAVLEGGARADEVAAGMASHHLVLDGVESPLEVMMPPFVVDGFVNVLGILDADQIRALRGAGTVGYSAVRINPDFENRFEAEVAGFRGLVEAYFADCGAYGAVAGGGRP